MLGPILAGRRDRPDSAITLLQQNLVALEDTLAQAQGEIATGLIQVYRAPRRRMGNPP